MKKFSIILILFISIFFYGCLKLYNIGGSNLISLKDLDTLNNKDILVYFGRPTCPVCSEFLPVLENVLQDEKKEIYYFNTDEWREHDKYQSIISLYEIESVPSIIKIDENGSIKKLDLLKSNFDLENTTQVKNKIQDFLKF